MSNWLKETNEELTYTESFISEFEGEDVYSFVRQIFDPDRYTMGAKDKKDILFTLNADQAFDLAFDLMNFVRISKEDV